MGAHEGEEAVNKPHGFLWDAVLRGGSRWSAASQEITPQCDDAGFVPLCRRASARLKYLEATLRISASCSDSALLLTRHSCHPQ
ncbi:hypothetical protein NQZ68_012038 [Dissostichus eleginoides]|nr:hypothetical protein NQZ68_012038 [Dissostichus eleginoides]